jgi:hypothetical protein
VIVKKLAPLRERTRTLREFTRISGRTLMTAQARALPTLRRARI